MANKNETIKAVDWMAVFPSLKLVKTGREALQPARLGLALLWVMGMVLGLVIADKLGLVWLSSPDGVPQAEGVAQVWLLLWAALWGGVGKLLAGSAIVRLAAIRVAVGDSARLREAKSFWKARGGSLLGGLFFLSLPLLAVGGVVVLADAVHWHGLAILMTVLLLALSVAIVPALMLLVPAVAVDGNDGFDAPGRAVSYVLARPWALALHLVVLAFFASVFVGLPCAVVYGGLWVSFGLPVPFWLHLVLWLPLLAYAFSFLFTGLTRIYFLIRESADGVPETEIWNPSDDKKVAMGAEDEQAHV